MQSAGLRLPAVSRTTHAEKGVCCENGIQGVRRAGEGESSLPDPGLFKALSQGGEV